MLDPILVARIFLVHLAHFVAEVVFFLIKINIPPIRGGLPSQPNFFRKFFCTNAEGPKLETLCPVGCCSGATLGLEEGHGEFFGV